LNHDHQHVDVGGRDGDDNGDDDGNDVGDDD